MKFHRWMGVLALAIVTATGEEAKPAGEAAAELKQAVPEGFKWQVMEPTGGRILRRRGNHQSSIFQSPIGQ